MSEKPRIKPGTSGTKGQFKLFTKPPFLWY